MWFFNRPRWLVAPHLRHHPGLPREIGGKKPRRTPVPKGWDPESSAEIGLAAGSLVVLMFAAMVGAACVSAFPAGAVGAAMAGVVCADSLYSGRRDGSMPSRCEDRHDAAPKDGTGAVVVSIALIVAAFASWGFAPWNPFGAFFLGACGAIGLVFAGHGLWLRLDCDLRRRAGRA